MFPIKPGQRNYLSGNMGELRTNHFHGGLDIKTDQRTGLAVYASADGYVSRILVSSKGYGNALYITHPNGLTTVYAHLEWFNKDIGRFVKDFLYKEQCNETDQYLLPGQLKVCKGDTIAWSGNTGSSGGPHLHWEIRDEQERILNPMFFHFAELEDHAPPFISKLAIRTMDINARIAGEFGRVEYTPAKEGEDYLLRYPIHANGWLGLELQAYDRMDGTGNFYGVSLIEVYLDGKPLFTHDIQRIAFDENPYINVHIDYETALKRKNFFQKCYIADGNNLSTYKAEKNGGRLCINDTLTHTINIKVYDTYRNHTALNFKIKGVKNVAPHAENTAKSKSAKPTVHSEEFENIVKVDIANSRDNEAAFYFQSKKLPILPAYTKGNTKTYLWDLRNSMPDSILSGSLKYVFGFSEALPSVNAISYSHPKMDLLFPKKSIFDTLFLRVEYAQPVFSIHKSSTPLFSAVSVTLKPDFEIPVKSKSAVYNVTGKNRFKYAGGYWIGDNIRFSTKIFGDFTVKTDTVPPKISYFKTIGKVKYFKMSDNLSGVAHWYAYLNGKFLLMHYEPKYNVIFTDMADESLPVSGDLLIGAIDNMGNLSTSFFRY